MEIIRVSGYTETEKLSIVRQLLSKRSKRKWLSDQEFEISDAAILELIRRLLLSVLEV